MIVRVRLSPREVSNANTVLLSISAAFVVSSFFLLRATTGPPESVPAPLTVRALPRLVPAPPPAKPSPRPETRLPIVQLTAWNCAAGVSQSIGPIIVRAASRYQVDHRLIRSVIERESASRTCATSPQGAAGLMQLMPETARHFGVRDVYDPQQNIEAGTRYLEWLLARYHQNLPLALAAYNAGPAAVDQHGGVPPFPETRRYVSKVMQALAAK